MSLVALANVAKRDIEGSLSVLSMPAGTPSMFLGKGRSMMVTVVSAREAEMKGRLAGVVKMVKVALRRRRRRQKSSSGMVWPLDMKGKRRMWGDGGVVEAILSL